LAILGRFAECFTDHRDPELVEHPVDDLIAQRVYAGCTRWRWATKISTTMTACVTIRLKLLKIGAVVRVTVRKVWVSFSESYPYRELFLKVLANIRGTPPVVLRC